ncbi:hypothetical protein K439DRAFT_1638333 [Ramaria rubella]|nr:hypothetical protein K439DRAFT_1638330 [Ramaria rubella]KAF8579050.1 hypothetical protein K439DRAFT_1638333 [Ramaria rubella]
MPYFLSRLSGSALQSTFGSYLSATFTISNFGFLAHATITSRQSNFSRHIRRSLLVLTVLTFTLTVGTFISVPAYPFFFFVLLNGILQAAAGAYLQSAVMALASLFGPSAIQPVLSGQAAVGVLVSLIQALSTGAGIRTKVGAADINNEKDDSPAARAAFLFFGASTVFLVFSIASHAWLTTMPTYKAVVLPFEAMKGVIGGDEEREALVGHRRTADHLPKKDRITDIAKMNSEYNFAVAYVFAVTLSVFPPITASVRSVNPISSPFAHPLLFIAIHFLLFSIGDFTGRYLPTVRIFQFWSSRTHLYMSLSRTLFVPLFLLCNVQRPSSPLTPVPVTGGVVINSDIMFFLIMILFGMSNGYISSLVMMAAPSPEHNPRLKHRPEDVDTAATIAQFCLVGGLVVGSFTSFGVRGAICACNPFTT